MGWLDRLKQRWQRGGRTGLPATSEPELEDRIYSSPGGDQQAGLLPEDERDVRHDEGQLPEQDERR